MPRKGRELEKLVERLERQLCDNDTVINSPGYLTDYTSGGQTEVDIVIKRKVGSTEILVIIECRDRKEPADKRWIDEIYGKKEGVHASVAIAVSKTGFSKNAIEKAKHWGIETRQFNEISIEVISSWLKCERFTVRRRHKNVSSITIKLEDIPDKKTTALNNFELNTFAPVLIRTSDGSKANFDDLIANALQAWEKETGMNIPIGQEHKKHLNLFLQFDKKDDRFQISLEEGNFDIIAVHMILDIWIEEEYYPISKISQYRNSEKEITDIVEVDIPRLLDGEDATLSFQRQCEDGTIAVTPVFHQTSTPDKD